MRKIIFTLAAGLVLAACENKSPSELATVPQMDELVSEFPTALELGGRSVDNNSTSSFESDLAATPKIGPGSEVPLIALASTNGTLGGISSRAAFLANVTITHNANFENVPLNSSGYYLPGPNWTHGGITYNSTQNLVFGRPRWYGIPTLAVCNNYWSPLTASAVAPGFSVLAFDVGLMGSVSPVTITVRTNITTYTFASLSVSGWPNGGNFFGFTAPTANEYITSFVLTSQQGLGSGPCIDNVVLGNAAVVNARPVANAGTDQTVNLNGSTTTAVSLDASASTDDGLRQPLTYTWQENGSTIASGRTPVVTLGLGTHVIVLTVNDGEHSASDAVTITVVDPSPPTITAHVTGTQGNNGWFVDDVAVAFTVTDLESAVTATGCDARAVTMDTHGQSFTCSAQSAGGSASETVSVKRDATRPVVTFGGNAGSYTVDQQVLITCTASDATSGVGSSTCPQVNAAAYTLPLGSNALNASAIDNAGNSSSASTSYTVSVTTTSLCALVNRFVAQRGIANSLCQKLNNAPVHAFVNEVNAQRDKAISSAHADILITLARAL